MMSFHLHENPTRTTPIGLIRYAFEFMEAALAADDKMGRRSGFEIIAPVPVMFLTGQSIELALKSFLLLKGIPLNKLRKDYGHNLHRSLRKAKELGLFSIVSLSEAELETIEILNTLYSSKELQYIVTGTKKYPAFGPLAHATRRLLHCIGHAVGIPETHIPKLTLLPSPTEN